MLEARTQDSLEVLRAHVRSTFCLLIWSCPRYQRPDLLGMAELRLNLKALNGYRIVHQRARRAMPSSGSHTGRDFWRPFATYDAGAHDPPMYYSLVSCVRTIEFGSVWRTTPARHDGGNHSLANRPGRLAQDRFTDHWSRAEESHKQGAACNFMCLAHAPRCVFRRHVPVSNKTAPRLSRSPTGYNGGRLRAPTRGTKIAIAGIACERGR